MEVSVSLPGEDVEFLDEYAREQGYESRSTVLHKAVRLLRVAELGTAYEGARDEWTSSGDAEPWEAVAWPRVGPPVPAGPRMPFMLPSLLDDRRELWDNRANKKEVTTMCWEREEPKKASEEIDEILKKIVKEAEKEGIEVPATAG